MHKSLPRVHIKLIECKGGCGAAFCAWEWDGCSETHIVNCAICRTKFCTDCAAAQHATAQDPIALDCGEHTGWVCAACVPALPGRPAPKCFCGGRAGTSHDV